MEYLISKGSKNQIATKIIDFLPAADTFYDLFCGGCAVAHVAMLSGKYDKVVINDANPMPSQLFVDALNGKYKDERRWISREDFFRLKDTDPYVKYCWSFSNNGCQYLYGKDKEEFKHGLHLAIFESDTRLLEKELGLPDGTIPHYEETTDISARYALYKKYLSNIIGGATQDYKQLNGLNQSGGRLQSLEALHNLGGQSKDRITEPRSNKKYSEILKLQSYINTKGLNGCE